MVATLLWGGCISCPQFFMFPSAEKAEKSCCQKNGQCERPTRPYLRKNVSGCLLSRSVQILDRTNSSRPSSFFVFNRLVAKIDDHRMKATLEPTEKFG